MKSPTLLSLPTLRICFLALLLPLSLAFGSFPLFSGDSVGLSSSKTVWAHNDSDLRPDDAITWGQLDNGFRYAILPNVEPPGRVSMRLLVQAGSLNESEDQLGFAHFLEHMAFNGTKEFPVGKMVQYFQRLGMDFGIHNNAHTSMNETVYKLELPRPEDALLRDGLRLMRDYADGILLEDEEVVKERGVILSEKRSRDSVSYRTMIEQYRFLFPEARFPHRLPIGDEAVIANTTSKGLAEFYQRWYRPDRMALIIVGQVNPQELSPLIEEYFASLSLPKQTAQDPDWGKIPNLGLVAKLHSEPEATQTRVALMTVQPIAFGQDNKKSRIQKLYRGLAQGILTRRLMVLAKEENSPFMQGSSYNFDWLDFARIGQIELTCKPDDWEAAVAIAEQELRRTVDHGFTHSEVKEMAAELINGFENAAKTAETRKSRDLANELTRNVSGLDVATHPGNDFDLAKEALERVTPKKILQAWRSLWGTDNTYLFVSGNLELKQGEAALLNAYQASTLVAVEPKEEEPIETFAYGDFGMQTPIMSRQYDEELNITQIQFANRARLNLKPTDFEKDTIHIMMRVGGGRLSESDKQPGLSHVASSTLISGGLIEHSADELKRIFAGKSVGGQFFVEADAFVFSAVTRPEDALQQLQLLCAYLLAPGFREESLRQMRKELDTLYLELEQTPEGVLRNQIKRYLASGNRRFGYPSKEILSQYTLDAVRAWLVPELRSGYLEISIVGDFEMDSILEMAGQTIGALPERAEDKASYLQQRQIYFPDVPEQIIFPYASDLPKAFSLVYWKTEDIWNINRTRRLNILGRILSERMRVVLREEMGKAYSPYAYNSSSETYSGYGYLSGFVETEPREAQVVTDIIVRLGQELRVKGITKDELERALQPTLTRIQDTQRNNRYWLHTVLGDLQLHQQRLEWARTIEQDYSAITVEEVEKLARLYLGEKHALQIVVLPNVL